MILTREIIIKINESNFSYYEELGYDVTIGEALVIPIELLSTGSKYKIDCKCDGCGVIKECTDTRRRNLCSYTGKIDSMPLNELIFSTMIIVVLEVRS